jgi:hypothetical protein
VSPGASLLLASVTTTAATTATVEDNDDDSSSSSDTEQASAVAGGVALSSMTLLLLAQCLPALSTEQQRSQCAATLQQLAVHRVQQVNSLTLTLHLFTHLYHAWCAFVHLSSIVIQQRLSLQSAAAAGSCVYSIVMSSGEHVAHYSNALL